MIAPTPYNRDPKYFFDKDEKKESLQPLWWIYALLAGCIAAVPTAMAVTAWFLPRQINTGPSFFQSRTNNNSSIPFNSNSLFTLALPAPQALEGCRAQAKAIMGNLDPGVATTSCAFKMQTFLSYGISVSPSGLLLTPTFNIPVGAEIFAWDFMGKPHAVTLVAKAGALSLWQAVLPEIATPVQFSSNLPLAGDILAAWGRKGHAGGVASAFDERIMMTWAANGASQDAGPGARILTAPYNGDWQTGMMVTNSEGKFLGIVLAHPVGNPSDMRWVFASAEWPRLISDLLSSPPAKK